jgi:hypothetical protein
LNISASVFSDVSSNGKTTGLLIMSGAFLRDEIGADVASVTGAGVIGGAAT